MSLEQMVKQQMLKRLTTILNASVKIPFKEAINNKKQLFILLAALLFVTGIFIYDGYFRPVWVSAGEFQSYLNNIAKSKSMRISCEEWIEKMHAEDGGPIIMRGPFRICFEVGRHYGKQAKCDQGELMILCDKRIEEP